MKGGGGVSLLCELFIIICLVKYSVASCTFPDPIRGNWISSEKGTLNFTNSTLWNYPIVLTAIVTSATFMCESTYNGYYFLKASSSFNFFNVDFYPYLCVDFTQISATKYIYSIECGAVSSLQAITTCPNDFLATFSNFTVTGYFGANQCTGNSLDVCTDRTAMNYTYNSCSSSVKFSSGGYFYCLYYQTNSSTGVTYLHVYNNDNTVVSGSIYRIVCYAFKKSGDIVYTTEYPGSCHTSQNATYVKSPGLITNYFNITKTCVTVLGSDIVQSGILDWKYIVAIVCGVTGLVILFIVIEVLIKKNVFGRSFAFICAKRRNVAPSQGIIEEIS